MNCTLDWYNHNYYTCNKFHILYVVIQNLHRACWPSLTREMSIGWQVVYKNHAKWHLFCDVMMSSIAFATARQDHAALKDAAAATVLI